MSEFKIIETQEQFDEAIKGRLERESKKWAEKYADYFSPEDLANKTAELNKKIEDLGNSLKVATDKANEDGVAIETSKKTITDLEQRIKKYETESVKNRVAHEMGVPYELANRLRGESEEEIKADAESLLKAFPSKSMPLGNPEIGHGEDEKADIRKLAKSLVTH